MSDPVKFEKGEDVTDLRDKLNKLAVQAAAPGAFPGMFVGAGLFLQRLIPSSGGGFNIVLGVATVSIAAATSDDPADYGDIARSNVTIKAETGHVDTPFLNPSGIIISAGSLIVAVSIGEYSIILDDFCPGG